MQQPHQTGVEVLGVDAGGTMTDTFFVDAHGEFVVGKAQTTPEDESVGLLSASADALEQWGRSVEEVFPQLLTGVYSGTAMLNRVVQRKGLRAGLIVSRGVEDFHRMGRAIQSYLGFAYEDRIHLNTHYYEPAARAAGADPRRHRASRHVRQRGDPAQRGRGRGRRGGAARHGRRGDRHLVPALVQEPGSRAARARHRARGRGASRRRRAGVRVGRLLPGAQGEPSHEHDDPRGLRGRAVAADAREHHRSLQGVGREVRRPRDEQPRRDDLVACEGARAHGGVGADRRRDRRQVPR